MDWHTHTHTHTKIKQTSNNKNTTCCSRAGEKKTVAKRFLTKKKDFIPGDRLEPPSSGNYRSQLSQDLWAADSEDSAWDSRP